MTAWDRILEQIGPDGQIGLQTALQAFALTVGPLPGVKPPPGAQPQLLSGSGPARWVLGHWAELTEEQRAAVRRYLPPPSELPAEATGTTAYAAGAAILPRPGDPTAQLQGMAEQLAAEIGQKLGRTFTAALRVVLVDSIEGHAKQPSAETLGFNANGGQDGDLATCVIYWGPRARAKSPAEAKAIMAHEIMHCLQFDLVPIERLYDSLAAHPWFYEGSAEWVLHRFAGTGAHGLVEWNGWLQKPGRGLFQRAYDAVGFYALLGRHGADPWKLLDRMQERLVDGGQAAYAFATDAGGEQMLDAWGSSHHQAPALGPQWALAAPGVPGTRPVVPVKALSDGAKVTLTAPPRAAALLSLDVATDVAVAQGDAHGWVAFGGKDNIRVRSLSGPMCARPGGCSCPAGGPGADVDFQTIGRGPAPVGIAGHSGGSNVEFSGMTLEAFCADAEQLAPALIAPCLLGTWVSTKYTVEGHTGGKGARLTVASDATVQFDFTPISKVIFAATPPGGPTGQNILTLRGKGAAQATTENGRIELDGSPDWLKLHWKIRSPLFGTIDYSAGAPGPTAKVVKLMREALQRSAFTCDGDVLEYGHFSWQRVSA